MVRTDMTISSIAFRSSWTSAAVALTIFTWASEASAFDPCTVPLIADPVLAGVALADCVDEVNQGELFGPDSIDFEGPQTYELKYPLELLRDVVIEGADQVLMPSGSFTGDALIIVGTTCPGPHCAGVVEATIRGMELTSGGMSGIRGIEVRDTHTLNTETLHVHDFTTTLPGACVFAGEQSRLDLDDSTFDQCVSTAEGGAIFSEASVTILRDCTLSANEADLGGAIAMGTGGAFSRKLRTWDTVFDGNIADYGGAVMATGANLSTAMVDSTFFANEAHDSGGGVYGGGDFTRCTFDGNMAADLGGGAYLEEESSVVDSTLVGNDAWRGGGLAVLPDGGFDMRVTGTTVVDNTASGPRNYPAGAGIYVASSSNPPTTGVTYILNSTISGNVTDLNEATGNGGGIGVARMTAVLEHVTLYGNEARTGGGLHASSSTPTNVTLDSSIVAGSGGAPGAACSIGGNATFQTTTSLDDDDSCGVAIPKSIRSSPR